MRYSLRSLMTFSIRDLFWITVVVALAVGWFVEQRRLASELSKEREFRSSLREIRGSLEAFQFKRVWGESPNSNALPQNLSSPFLPKSSAPAANSPKK